MKYAPSGARARAWSESTRAARWSHAPGQPLRRARQRVTGTAHVQSSPPPQPSPPLERRQPVTQVSLPLEQPAGTVLATRRRAHERYSRGGWSPGKARARSYRLPRLHHRVSPDRSRRTIASGRPSGDRSDRTGPRWSGCHPPAGC